MSCKVGKRIEDVIDSITKIDSLKKKTATRRQPSVKYLNVKIRDRTSQIRDPKSKIPIRNSQIN
jgi:hypothetical protein